MFANKIVTRSTGRQLQQLPHMSSEVQRRWKLNHAIILQRTFKRRRSYPSFFNLFLMLKLFSTRAAVVNQIGACLSMPIHAFDTLAFLVETDEKRDSLYCVHHFITYSRIFTVWVLREKRNLQSNCKCTSMGWESVHNSVVLSCRLTSYLAVKSRSYWDKFCWPRLTNEKQSTVYASNSFARSLENELYYWGHLCRAGIAQVQLVVWQQVYQKVHMYTI